MYISDEKKLATVGKRAKVVKQTLNKMSNSWKISNQQEKPLSINICNKTVNKKSKEGC